MSALPRWVNKARAHPGKYDGPESERYMGCCNVCDDVEKIREALAIAWETMEYAYHGHTIKEDGMSVQSRPLSKSEIQVALGNAMRRIAALGEE